MIAPPVSRLNCGRKPTGTRRRQCEECGRLTVRQWLAGETPPDLGTVEPATTRPHLGGERSWFVCPGCRRRVGVLYQPGRGDPWECRTCHNLVHRSAQQAHRGERLTAAFERIDRHIEANGGDWGPHPESLFEGLAPLETLALANALVHIDRARLEADRLQFREDRRRHLAARRRR